MFILLFTAALAPTPDRPDLKGVVQDTAGRPLARATVFIRTAGPRKGIGIL